MADAAPKAPAAQGAGSEHLDDGQGLNGAPKAPVVNNAPAPKEGLDEELGADGKPKPTAEQIAADKATKDAADAEAARVAEEAAKPKPELKEYIVLEDPAGQAAIDLLKEAGVSPTEANAIFEKAVASGDLADIDVFALEAKVGKTKATLIMSGVTDFYTRQSVANTAAVTAVHDIMGGEENWNTVRTWAQAKEKTDGVFKHRLDQCREMLNKGGLYAESAGRELARLYGADPSTKGLNNGKPLTAGGTNFVDVGKPMSRSEYVKELHAAHDRGAKPAEIAALDKRRLAGKTAGI